MNNILAITYAFMLAVCPDYNTGLKGKHEVIDDSTHVQFQLGLELYDSVHIYAGEETYQKEYDGLFSWFPYTQAYWIGAEYEKEFNEALTLKAGIYHRCQHPLNCWKKQKSTFNSAETSIYLCAEGKIKVF